MTDIIYTTDGKLSRESYREVYDYTSFETGNGPATYIARKSNEKGRPTLMYCHGYVDYFFHDHVAAALNDAGWNFIAIELRRYGHSLRTDEQGKVIEEYPNYINAISDYSVELDYLVDRARELSPTQPIVLMGHSLGGLITSVYASTHDTIDALVQNGPFYDVAVPKAAKPILFPIIKMMAGIRPYGVVPGLKLESGYAESVHSTLHGEWDYDMRFKPYEGFPVYWGWGRAVLRAQEYLRKQEMSIPTLLLKSAGSTKPSKWCEAMQGTDSVLNVEDMPDRGPHFSNLETHAYEQGMHDIFLSRKNVREQALQDLISWIGRLQ